MTKEPTYLKELRELHENHDAGVLEAALGITIRSVQNYLNPDMGRVPKDKIQEKIHETFANYRAGKPIVRSESGESSKDNPALHSLARSLELSAEARLIDSESRKAEADNVKRLIALLEMKIQGKAGLELPPKGTPGTRTYKPEEKGKEKGA